MLLVKKDAATGADARAVLRAAGFTVLNARTAEHALRLVADHSVDVAVIDDLLTDASGSTLTIHLKEIRPALYVVLLTGNAPISDDLGRADCVIPSSASSQDLLRKVLEFTARRAAQG